MNGFLLDENIPNRITFTARLPIFHARDLGQSLSDTALWVHAQSHEYVIVTKDADFSNRIMLSRPPPWVVHLKIGNLRRVDFHSLMKKMWPEIESFLPTNKLINVYSDRIEAVG